MRTPALVALLGLAVGCSQSSSESPRLDASPSVDTADAPGDAPAAFDVGADGLAGPIRCGSDAAFPPDLNDPTMAVTDWSQVQHYNCARNEAGQIITCSSDGQCPTGRVCDTSAGCGCCVLPPPLLDNARPLHRALFTGCANGRCSPPSYCTVTADARACTMTFPGTVAVWAMHHQPPANACPLDDFRRQLCIKVEPWQSCLWLLELPAGSTNADVPFPTDYTDIYECGGRTCNGADTFRVRPQAGMTFTATLVIDNCSP